MSGSAAPLRWLIVGSFSATPTGRITPVSGERFSNVMKKVGPKLGIDVTDRIGADTSRHVELSFSRLREFRAPDVIAADDTLRQLDELAGRLEKGKAAGDPAAAVERIAGPGVLASALRGETPAAAPAPAPAPTASDETPAPASSDDAPTESPGDGIDAIFSKVAATPVSAGSESKSAVSSFIGAMRAAGSAKTTTASERDRASDAASLIRAAVRDTVTEVLDHARVRELEVAWRGLSAVVAAAPGADDMAIDLLDAEPGDAEAIDHALSRPGMDRADAVFVAWRVEQTAPLCALAQVGARHHVPIVVEIPDSLAGLTGDNEDEPEPWAQLRSDGRAVYLAAVANPPALYEEPAPYARVRFGAAALAIGAMTAASVARTAIPADVLGGRGEWTAPAAHDIEIHGQALTIPTEAFCDVAGQQRAAARGVIRLGSEAGRPAVRLTACPTVGGGSDAPALPGRIVAGRATRLAHQVRQEHPTASSAELAAALDEAKGRLLPKADTSAVALTVRTDGEDVKVDGSIGANLAGASFKFSSDV